MGKGASAEGLNEDVLDGLLEKVESPSGNALMLLTAPRAGYGKTHLLGRVAAAAGTEAVMVPLAFRSGDVLKLATVTQRGLEALSSGPGGSPGWLRLREICAGVVAHLLHGLIEEGLVPSANPAQAQRVLSGPPYEVFDPDGAAHLIGDWLKKHASGLRPVLARRISKAVPVTAEHAEAWLEAMLAQAFEGGTEGLATMLDLAGRDTSTGIPAWLRMVALWRPVIVMVDHLDGYYRNAEAGVAIASLLMELVESHGLHVLMSLNQDVWQATFGHHLPSALEDRLTASQVLLKGLREADAAALLKLRLSQALVSPEEAGEFEEFLNLKQYFLGRPVGSVSARMFLRHCARHWELFQNSVPFSAELHPGPPEVHEVQPEAEALVFPGLPEAPGSINPPPEALLPLDDGDGDDTEALQDPPLPETIFDKEDSAGLSQMAESLAEPRHELPQDEGPDVLKHEPPPAAGPEEAFPKPSPAPLPLPEGMQSMPSQDEPPASGQEAASAQDWQPPLDADALPPPVSPSSDAFVKLREMLHHLRQPGARPAPAEGLTGLPQGRSVLPVAATSGWAKEGTPSGTATASAPAKVLSPGPVRAEDALLGRFEALRLQMNSEAETQPVDYARLAELIRLAGRRFPLVRFSEHELPNLPGRQTMVWELQGVELLFGLAPFSDTAYWRILAGFAAGRSTDLAEEAARTDSAPARLKLVTFKSDLEQPAWQSLLNSEALPGPVRPFLDAVHLDGHSLAALYAMQRIIKDAETGTVQAEPAQVMTVLARELDFFWKRITRI